MYKNPQWGGYGVYSRGDTKAGTRVGGCYGGVVIVTENKDDESVLPFEMQKSDYVFSFGVDDKGTMCTAFVDALSPFKCSVLRFVNSSTSEKSANVESHIDKGRVYLVTSKDVKDGEEFFMFYGWAYWFKRASLLR
jgi:SET domain-containing protein